MSHVEIVLPDNKTLQFDHEPTALEVAGRIGSRLQRDTVGVIVNGDGVIRDLRQPLAHGAKVELVTINSARGVEVVRHSCAHIMAEAVQGLWPEVKVTIGPIIEDGFYYDFHSPRPFTEEDFEQIERRMAEIVKAKRPFTREEWSSEKARTVFREKGESFKVELIDDLNVPEVSIYSQATWFDLCRGPHVQHTGQVGAFKLLSVAGSFWRGDEKRDQLQRLYATAFNTKEELDQFITRREEAQQRDHRRLCKALNLFTFTELSPGAPLFTAEGAVIYTQLQSFLRDLYFEHGYGEVITPQIFDVALFERSGHMATYAENMFFTEIEGRQFAQKPMNCPSHCLLFGSKRRSYRELPVRMADFGRLHRFERSGTMHGLTRVRSFCQDDAHIFCAPGQLRDEIIAFVRLLQDVYARLGMNDYHIKLSTRPEKRIGSDEVWDRAEEALRLGLEALGLPYTINPGDGAFYGPKLDIGFVDAIGRPWQLGTLQCDFNLPERFDLTFIDEDNREVRPVMLHRAILGSLERFIGVYLEHTAGNLPLWLAPTQISILGITDRVDPYCRELLAALRREHIRAEYDDRNEKLNYKVRQAEVRKVPLIVVVGDREAAARTVSVRISSGAAIDGVALAAFVARVTEDVKGRKLQNSFEG